MRERESEEVLAHLRAENAYTEASLAHLATFRERLFQEIKSRIQETDLSVPARKGPWWYLIRTEEGRQYPVSCRRRLSKKAVIRSRWPGASTHSKRVFPLA